MTASGQHPVARRFLAARDSGVKAVAAGFVLRRALAATVTGGRPLQLQKDRQCRAPQPGASASSCACAYRTGKRARPGTDYVMIARHGTAERPGMILSQTSINPWDIFIAASSAPVTAQAIRAAAERPPDGAPCKEPARPRQICLQGAGAAADRPYLALSHADFAASGGELPSFADLLGLCARGVDASWALAWRVVYAKTYLALPSLGRTGIRSGSRAGRRPPSGSRAAAIGKGICDNWCAGARRDPTNESGKP